MKKMIRTQFSENTKYLFVAARNTTRREKFTIGGLLIIQISLSILDLVGVALLGLVGAISISGIQSAKPTNQIQSILQNLNLENLSFQNQVGFLAVTAAVILFTRTALSIFFSRRTLFYFAGKAALLSGKIAGRLLSQDFLFLTKRTNQETIFASTVGCNLLYVGVLAQSINLVSDFALLLTLGIGIFLVDPIIALSSIFIFTLSAAIMNYFLNTRAQVLGQKDAELSMKSNSKLLEIINSYREIFVHNQKDYYSEEVREIRSKSAFTQAELAFLPSISKYIVESTLLLGALIVSAIQFVSLDAKSAITALTFFLAAGTRLAPALLRVQQGILSVRNSFGQVQSTLHLMRDLNSAEHQSSINCFVPLIEKSLFSAGIEVKSLNLKYPNSEKYALQNIEFSVPPGSIVAIVGPSGAGKTSLIDVMLGIINPSAGTVKISGQNPVQAIKSWPTAISYVPQDSFIVNGTIRENISLGFPIDQTTDLKVQSALKKAQLLEFVLNLPNGLDHQVGENGGTLSGGQRQRLGIARALFTEPKMLILDEATSSLDAETEFLITDAINSLRGDTTVVLIAHRLSSVRNADFVVYLEGGVLVAKGKFEEVRAAVPQFDKQAKLMGL